MTETGLKPCPFCGELPDAEGQLNYLWIKCNNELCHMIVITKCKNMTKAEAIAAWNRRV